MIAEIQFRKSIGLYFNITMFSESGKSEYYKVSKKDLIEFIRNNNKNNGTKKNVQ